MLKCSPLLTLSSQPLLRQTNRLRSALSNTRPSLPQRICLFNASAGGVSEYGVSGTEAALGETEHAAISAELEKNGISVEIDIENVKDNEQEGNEENTVKYVDVTGKITDIRTATTGGETYFYIKLDDADRYYKVSVKDAEKIILVNNGDSVTFEIPEKAEGNIVTVKTVK